MCFMEKKMLGFVAIYVVEMGARKDLNQLGSFGDRVIKMFFLFIEKNKEIFERQYYAVS